jgi:hypothetical protein
MNTVEYLMSHRDFPVGVSVGIPRLRADFGGSPGPGPEPAPDVAALLQEVQTLVDRARFETRAIDMEAAWSEVGVASVLLGQARDLLGSGPGPKPGPGPEPPPGPGPEPSPGTDSFGGSYGPEHDPAFDLYPNGEEGPHRGHVFRCPTRGRVEKYSVISPLGSGPDAPLRVWWEPGDGTGRELPAAEQRGVVYDLEQERALRLLGTQLHIAVFWPEQPLPLPDGRTLRVLWIGHVRSDVPVGPREAGDPLAVCWNSGIEFAVVNPRTGQPIDASHGHVAGSATGRLSPNGDVPGLWVAQLLGYRPRVTRVPGPADYASGRWDRGKPIE